MPDFDYNIDDDEGELLPESLAATKIEAVAIDRGLAVDGDLSNAPPASASPAAHSSSARMSSRAAARGAAKEGGPTASAHTHSARHGHSGASRTASHNRDLPPRESRLHEADPIRNFERDLTDRIDRLNGGRSLSDTDRKVIKDMTMAFAIAAAQVSVGSRPSLSEAFAETSQNVVRNLKGDMKFGQVSGLTFNVDDLNRESKQTFAAQAPLGPKA